MHVGNISKGCFKILSFFFVYVVMLCVLLLPPTTSVLHAERGTYYRFFLLCLPYYYCCFLRVCSIAVAVGVKGYTFFVFVRGVATCLLYTSDAADE